jgi:hypothetical protein
MAGLTLIAAAGCASPGPPLPPSLKLPEVVTNLAATRVGDEVTLRWTTPARTTDKLLISGTVVAEICREASFAKKPASTARNAGKITPCSPIMRLKVTPGESEAADPLPASLLSEPASLVAYRVQLLNAAGRTAGPSVPVFVASGPAPGPVENLHAIETKRGVMLEWKAERSQETGSGESIELDRNALEAPAPVTGEKKSVLPIGAKEPLEARLHAGESSGQFDAGGTIDRTAQMGHTYRYTAQGVRTVTLGDQTLEVRSVPSAEVTVAMNDVFPPDVPAGLVAISGVEADGAAQKPTVDLSWEPVMESRLAGYRVYRREMDGDAPGAWGRLDVELVRVAAYRDLTVAAGHKYAYRVTAVNEAGNESGPSDEVTETAPAQ